MTKPLNMYPTAPIAIAVVPCAFVVVPLQIYIFLTEVSLTRGKLLCPLENEIHVVPECVTTVLVLVSCKNINFHFIWEESFVQRVAISKDKMFNM